MKIFIYWQFQLHLLAIPITSTANLEKQPKLPSSLTLYPRLRAPYVDPLERWLVNNARGVEFMDPDFNADCATRPASNGIVIKAVIFQQTILLPNFGRLNQLPSEGAVQGIPIYKWSAIKHLVHCYCSLERAVDPITVNGTALQQAFTTGILKLEFKPNYSTNTGHKIPVYACQIFEADFALYSCLNPIYFINVDEPNFHSFKIDKSAGCEPPEGYNIYPWKLQVVQE